MERISSLELIISLLKEGYVITYKPYNNPRNFLILKGDKKIKVFNEHLSYYINEDDLKELANLFEFYLYN
jgi:hypothetical protein